MRFKKFVLSCCIVTLVPLFSNCADAKSRKSVEKKPAAGRQNKPQVKTSPSGKTVARKVNWLNHYLPEDRRLIRGYWTVVSTDQDSQYHRANCSRMLRQPAGGVIGFPFSADASEAGYLACPVCKPPSPQVSYAMVPPGDKAAYAVAGSPLKDNGGSLGDPYMGADGQPTQKAWEMFFAIQGRVGGLSGAEQQFRNSTAYKRCNEMAMQTNQAALAEAADKREERRRR